MAASGLVCKNPYPAGKATLQKKPRRPKIEKGEVTKGEFSISLAIQFEEKFDRIYTLAPRSSGIGRWLSQVSGADKFFSFDII